MGSKLRKPVRKMLIMFPLMDMFFILLVFYLMVHGGTIPIKRNVGLPQPVEIGEANTIIQIIDEDSFLWLDSTAIKLFDTEGELALRKKATINKTRLVDNISDLLKFLKSHNVSNYLVLIRCPGRVEYYVVDDLFNRLSGYSSPEEQASGGVLGTPINSMLVSLMGGSAEDLSFGSGKDGKRNFLQVGFRDE